MRIGKLEPLAGVTSMNLETFEAQVYSEWDRLQPVINQALPYLDGGMNEVGLISAVLSGRMFLWPLEDAFVITSVEDYENLKVYCIVLLGGDWKQIVSLLPQVEAHAKDKGCSHLETYSRVGLFRSPHMKEIGFKPYRVLFRKEL